MKVRAIARGLALRDHHVTVLTTDLGIEALAQRGELSRLPQGWQSSHDAIETIYLTPRARYRALTWNPGVYEFCSRQLASFDVVHVYGLYDLLAPPVARACRRLGIPYVVEPMGMFRPIVRNITLKWLHRRLFGDALVHGAQRVVATSDQEQRELIEDGVAKEKVVIRRNGMEPPTRLPVRGSFRDQWRIPADSRLVLYLGRVVSKKSPELLLEAFARWRARSTSRQAATLVLAGPYENGNYRRQLEERSAKLGLSAQVLFAGPLYDDSKWAAFQDADLFVLPSQNENFGNTAAEAVACGTPVIVTDRCGVAPWVDGRAGLVIPHDGEALTSALARFFDDDHLRRRLEDGCAVVAAELGWQEPLAQTEALYQALCEEVRRS